jgi:hypothetical protein
VLHIQCKQCGKWTMISPGVDPDAALECNCCTLNHHHGQAANGCAGAGGNHVGQPCHMPDNGMDCVVFTEPGEDCPGQHCGPGVPGCSVCRPITITLPSALVDGGVN